MQRRVFLRQAAGLGLGLVAAAAVSPALADTIITPQQGGGFASSYTAGANQPWTGWTTSSGLGYAYVYLFTNPDSNTTIIGNIPVNEAVTITAYAPGEILAPPNPIWYQVSSSVGTGWVYSGLVTEIQPIMLPASAVAPPPGPIPAPVGSGRSIGVSLSRQWLWAYDSGAVALQAPVTTGMPQKPTPTGIYAIQKIIPKFKFLSPWAAGSPFWYPDSATTYALQFRTDGYYIHDAPWRPYYGPGTNLPHLDPDGSVRAGSHGCINTQLNTILFLASWVSVGTPVRIIV